VNHGIVLAARSPSGSAKPVHEEVSARRSDRWVGTFTRPKVGTLRWPLTSHIYKGREGLNHDRWATLQPLDGTLRFCTARRHLAQRIAGGLEFKSERANHPRRQAAGNALLCGCCKPIKRYLTGPLDSSSNLAPGQGFEP
jgi:hypothetical protein